MAAFEQFDHTTSAKDAQDGGVAALYSDAYSAKPVKFDEKLPAIGNNGTDLPGLTITGGDKLDLKQFLPEVQHQEDLKKYDKDHNGKLDGKELQTAIDESKDLRDFIRFRDLKDYDKNHDGVIDAKEDKKRQDDAWKAHMEELKKYDTNGDGKIDDKERQKQIDELVEKIFKNDKIDTKKPLTEKEMQEETRQGIDDLKKGVASGDLTAVIEDLERAKAKMSQSQYEKYLAAANEEFHKYNPNADIVGPFQQNGKHQMEVRSKSGDISVIVDNNEVDIALGVRNISNGN